MDDQSFVDISIRNVPVRLNDSNKTTEMNGDCVNSLHVTNAVENDPKVTCYNKQLEVNHCSNGPDFSDEFREKLHFDTDQNCGLVNGCTTKLLSDNLKCVDLPVNGLNKTSFELLNAHLNKLSHRTCNTLSNQESQNTETEPNENSDTSSITAEQLPTCEIKPSEAASHSLSELSPPQNGQIIPDPTGYCDPSITYLGYESECQMPDIMRLIQKDLSEPYSIYTYRYFIHNWPKLCFLALDGSICVGAIVCKLDLHKKQSRRGYIAMLAVDENYRKRKIGSQLVLKAIRAMVQDNADEVVLETEITNKPALKLYENLGFVRDKRLFRYYLNGVDALRLKLWLR